MDFQQIKELDSEYLAKTYARYPVALVGGKNATLVDSEGKEYIDFGAGIAVNIFGANDEEWKAAVIEQLGKIQHVSNYYYAEPQVRLAQMLCERTGAKRVFFSNSGGEANECALKAARKYSFMKYGAGRSRIVSLKNRGESGVTALSPSFVSALSRWCTENDVLLICDEVQCGNGRCGTLYAYEQYSIKPDIVTTAKGLAGGLPIGACLFFERAQDAFSAGDHGSTFGGNPVSCAAAVNVISRITPEFLLEVQGKAAYLRAKLKNFEGVKEVTGLGMMIGLEIEKDSKQVAKACLEKGLLVLTAHRRLRLVPPLTITKTEMDEGLSILREVLK